MPYVSDGAFSVHDSHVIARAARVALLRDEPWVGEILRTLLPQVSVAPTEANSTPCGAPMDVTLPEGAPQLAAVPWLPYDEQLLQKIVNTVAVLLTQ